MEARVFVDIGSMTEVDIVGEIMVGAVNVEKKISSVGAIVAGGRVAASVGKTISGSVPMY